jgi:hypothetical protein
VGAASVEVGVAVTVVPGVGVLVDQPIHGHCCPRSDRQLDVGDGT